MDGWELFFRVLMCFLSIFNLLSWNIIEKKIIIECVGSLVELRKKKWVLEEEGFVYIKD